MRSDEKKDSPRPLTKKNTTRGTRTKKAQNDVLGSKKGRLAALARKKLALFIAFL